MSMTTNDILKQGGLYDDVIGVVGDYLYGTKAQYKEVMNDVIRDIDIIARNKICNRSHFREMRTIYGFIRSRRFMMSEMYDALFQKNMSYNEYMWSIQNRPLMMELTKRFINKLKMDMRGATAAEQKFMTKFYTNKDYFEGMLYRQTDDPANIINNIMPYLRLPWKYDEQNKFMDVFRQIRDTYRSKHKLTWNKKFNDIYLIYENDFVIMRCYKIKDNNLYVVVKPKYLFCQHTRCRALCQDADWYEGRRLYKKLKIQTDKNGDRYVRFTTRIYKHNQKSSRRQTLKRYEKHMTVQNHHLYC